MLDFVFCLNTLISGTAVPILKILSPIESYVISECCRHIYELSNLEPQLTHLPSGPKRDCYGVRFPGRAMSVIG